MTPDTVFSLCTNLALIGWFVLALVPRWERGPTLLVPVIACGLLAAVYAAIVIAELPGADGGFGSLDDVSTLFANPWLLLAGWVHYLAFDLFIGAWEVRDSRALGIPHLAVLPCLAFTFVLGPVGLLLYLALRRAKAGRVALGHAPETA
ncbi:MAG: ABA4-like family protein [Gemmatimonadota bacterium]|nr:ABA4-like family protein [Gemmatimonadota bacterium]